MLPQIGAALFEAAVGIVGAELVEAWKTFSDRRTMRNHDVTRALRDAYLATLGILERESRTLDLSRADRSATREGIVHLRARVEDLFPLHGEQSDRAPHSADVDPLPTVGDLPTAQTLKSLIGGVPEPLSTLLDERFTSTFGYAFRELGLKRNERVRAVLFDSLLTQIRENTLASRESLQEIGTLLVAHGNETMSALEQQHDRLVDISGDLEKLLDHFAAMMTVQQEVRDRLDAHPRTSRSASTPDPVVSIVLLAISQDDGTPIARRSIPTGSYTIGRDQSDVTLPDARVSREHAVLHVTEKQLSLEHRSSTGPTLIRGSEVRGSTTVRLHDEIRIGPFCLFLLPLGTATEHIPVPTRIEDDWD